MSWSATARKNVASATGVASLNVTLNSSVAGNMIAVASSAWKATGPTSMAVSDGANGSYTSALFAVNGSPAIALHYLPNNVGGNLTITATPGPGSTYDMAIAAHEFSGGDTSAPLSGTPATNTGTGTTDSTGTITPADNDVLLLAVLDHDSYTAVTENAGSEGFTLSNENEGPNGQPISLVYKIITGAPGTPSHSWSAGVSSAWAAGIAAFKTPSVANIPSAIGWRNRQNPRLRGPIKQSRFQRTQLWSTDAAVTSITGTAAITEADDSVSAAATVLVTGSAAITEGADTVSSAATHPVTADASITEGADTLSSAATHPVTAGSSITEADDTTTAAGTVLVTANAAITEGADTLSASGGSGTFATLNITEADDGVTAAGAVLVSGSGTITEAGDGEAAAATVRVTATGVSAESGDTVSSQATNSTPAGDLQPAVNIVVSFSGALYEGSFSGSHFDADLGGRQLAVSLT